MKRGLIISLLGLILALSFGCSGKDNIRKIRSRAEQGEVAAQYELGVRYANGDQAPKDLTTAMTWYRKAAEQGHGDAQVALGRALANGEGTPKDAAGGLKWFLKAAEQGTRSGQIAAGLMYLKGEGTPVNLMEGYVWLTVAQAKTPELDGKNLETVAADLSPRQQAEATALIDELSKRLPKR